MELVFPNAICLIIAICNKLPAKMEEGIILVAMLAKDKLRPFKPSDVRLGGICLSSFGSRSKQWSLQRSKSFTSSCGSLW